MSPRRAKAATAPQLLRRLLYEAGDLNQTEQAGLDVLRARLELLEQTSDAASAALRQLLEQVQTVAAQQRDLAWLLGVALDDAQVALDEQATPTAATP